VLEGTAGLYGQALARAVADGRFLLFLVSAIRPVLVVWVRSAEPTPALHEPQRTALQRLNRQR
jgi:hypothetical protein